MRKYKIGDVVSLCNYTAFSQHFKPPTSAESFKHLFGKVYKIKEFYTATLDGKWGGVYWYKLADINQFVSEDALSKKSSYKVLEIEI